MRILFTICGRAGSKGFKNKNLKEMNGVPLVYYTLSAILCYKETHSDEIDVALNTDSEHLIDLIKRQDKLEVKIVPRKPQLAGDTIGKVDVIKDTFVEVGETYDVVIDLDLTSPMRTVRDIEKVISVYNENSSFEWVTTVVPSRRSPYFNMVEENDGAYKQVCKTDFTARQQAPLTYDLNASIYAYRPSFLAGEINGTLLDYRLGISIMEDYLVLDIDSEEDFVMMSKLHKYYCSIDEGIKEIFETAKVF